MSRFRLEFCKRGHLMAEARRIIGGRLCCGICSDWRSREDRKNNPARRREAQRKYRLTHPPSKRQTDNFSWRLKKCYGITLEQYNEMVEVQRGRCAICDKTQSVGRRLAVDHDHDTGFVRGLLCDGCNLMIGRLKDSPSLLDRMRRYLVKHSQLRLVG